MKKLIHTGNYTRQTLGCILVGTSANVNGCTITGSATAYKALRTAFYGSPNPNRTPDKPIKIVIKDDF